MGGEGCAERTKNEGDGEGKMTVTNLIHGLSKSRQYYIWRSMKQRIENPKRKDYPHYGGRGIKYDPAWAGFIPFWEDMSEGYADDLTLDRIDPNKDYCKENCRWVPMDDQARGHRKHPGNKSGVTGVHYRAGQDCWRAIWCDGHGNRKEKSFYCKKVGYEQAFSMACQYREEMIKRQIEKGFEYSEFHGK